MFTIFQQLNPLVKSWPNTAAKLANLRRMEQNVN